MQAQTRRGILDANHGQEAAMETVQRLETISRQVRVTELPIASVSKRVFVQNLLHENVSDLQSEN